MSQLNHVQRVRLLYKGILRLHRGLPHVMKEIGNSYAKDEFQRHKNANQQQAQLFMQEWTKYYVTLANQLGKKSNFKNVGQKLDPSLLESLSQDQLVQLHELYSELKSDDQVK